MIAEKNGFANVANEYFKRSSTDSYPVVTRLAGTNPDLIDFGGTIGHDQSLGCKALRGLGYWGKTVLGYSDAKSFVEVAGADTAEGTLLFDTLVDPQNVAAEGLAGMVAKEIRTPFPTFAFSVCDTLFILVMGMKNAQSAYPVKIVESLHGAHLDGLYGPEVFGMKSATASLPRSLLRLRSR